MGTSRLPSMRMRRSGREKGELEYSQMWTYPSGFSRNMAGSGKGPSASRTFLGLLMKRPHLQGRQEAGCQQCNSGCNGAA